MPRRDLFSIPESEGELNTAERSIKKRVAFCVKTPAKRTLTHITREIEKQMVKEMKKGKLDDELAILFNTNKRQVFRVRKRNQL